MGSSISNFLRDLLEQSLNWFVFMGLNSIFSNMLSGHWVLYWNSCWPSIVRLSILLLLMLDFSILFSKFRIIIISSSKGISGIIISLWLRLWLRGFGKWVLISLIIHIPESLFWDSKSKNLIIVVFLSSSWSLQLQDAYGLRCLWKDECQHKSKYNNLHI